MSGALLDLLQCAPSCSTVYVVLRWFLLNPNISQPVWSMHSFCEWVSGEYQKQTGRKLCLRPAETMDGPLYSVYRCNRAGERTDYQRLLQLHPKNEVTYCTTLDGKDPAGTDVSLHLLGEPEDIPKFEELEAEAQDALDKVMRGEKTMWNVYEKSEMAKSWVEEVD